MATVPFAPYPQGVGSKQWGLVPAGHKGPASYVQFAAGVGGDKLGAVEFGFKNIEWAKAGISSDGLYTVEVQNPTAGPATTVKMRWVVIATGSEVATAFNLSGSTVNCFAIGSN